MHIETAKCSRNGKVHTEKKGQECYEADFSDITGNREA